MDRLSRDGRADAADEQASPRECWDGSGRRRRADGVIDGSAPTPQGGSPVGQGGGRYGIRETGHWGGRWRGGGRDVSDVSNPTRKRSEVRGGRTCVQLGRIHGPHHGVEFPPRSLEGRENEKVSVGRGFRGESADVSPESSPFTRGVWGFLVTTLAVALFT